MAARKYSNKRKKVVNRYDAGSLLANPLGMDMSNPIIPSMGDFGIKTATDISNSPIPSSLAQNPTASSGLSSATKGLIGAAAGAVGNIGGNLISGGLQSGAGNAISGIGSTIGGAISAVNPMVGGIVSGASGLLGGITNALFGSKLNQERINDIESGIDTLNNIQVDDSSTNSILNQFSDTTFGQTFKKKDIGSDGLFSNKAKNTYKRLKKEQAAAVNRALSNFDNAASNVQENQIFDSMANYAAYGGPITMRYTGPMSPFGNTFADGGEIHIKKSKRGTFTAAAKKHGKSVQAFASQVLANKDNYSPAMVKKANFARNASKWHAEGGWLDNTHGGIFDNGVTTINEGGTHETNPFEGIQLGVDNQGIPNLVEEGEVVYNDYVYSNRIKAPKVVKESYKLRGNTFADLAENAQKESEERPNDPISQRGLQDIMAKLAMEQESIKVRKEERKANKYAKGGHLYPDGGFTYGTDMLNLDRSINTADLYKQGSNYMNARQYVLDNWDTPYVQDWLNNYYKPFVTSYNKSRGYNGSFNVNKDQFEKGTYDSSFGGMHQGLLNFQYPEGNTGAASPSSDAVTAYTLRDFLGNPVRSYAPGSEPTTYMGSRLSTSTYIDADGNTINYLDPSLGLSKKSAGSTVETNKGKDKGKGNGDNKANPLTYLRYAPALGGAIGLTQSLLSKPDYSNADAILEASRNAGRYIPVSYKPIGNYLTYTPFDRDYYTNKLAAQAGATRRAITGQSAGNRATAMAGLLAAGYNAQNSLGNLARQAAEYNFANRQAVETFNRGTNQANSEMALKAAMANQDAYARSAASRLQGTAQAMAMRQAIDDARNAGIAANFSNIFQSLGDIGREEVERSWIKNNPFLYYDTSTNGRGINYKGKDNSKSYGGYITRKNKKKGGKR